MLFGADWPLHKIAATVGAGVFKQVVRAISAKGALIGAYSGVIRCWRQVFITTFAIGFEGQHRQISYETVGRLAVIQMA